MQHFTLSGEEPDLPIPVVPGDHRKPIGDLLRVHFGRRLRTYRVLPNRPGEDADSAVPSAPPGFLARVSQGTRSTSPLFLYAMGARERRRKGKSWVCYE